MPSRLDVPKRLAEVAPWVLAILFAVIYGGLGIVRYASYHASCDDGLFVQSISSAFHGFYDAPEGASHFAYHFSPILYLLAPLIWTWKSAIVLIIVQAAACGLTIPPVYWIARKRVPALPALLVAAIAGLYPALGGVAFTDFSEEAFAPAAAAWLVWAIDARRMPAAMVFAVACLSIKEDQAVVMTVVGAAGAVYFWRRRERKWAAFSIGLATLSVATFVAFITLVRPASGVAYGYPSIRDFYGGMNPLPLVLGLFSIAKLGYVLMMLLPLLGICLLSRCMVLAIPGLLECLLSRAPVTYTLGQHYAAIWLPYVLIAFALGVAFLWRRFPDATLRALAVCVIIGIFINLAASPNLWSSNLSSRDAAHAILDGFIKSLPADASITAFCPVYAHLGMFPGATVFAKMPTQWVVIYPERDVAGWDAIERRFVAASGRYRAVVSTDDLQIYEQQVRKNRPTHP